MKKIATENSIAESLMMVQDFANQNYTDGMLEGFNLAVKALENQVEMQTSGIGSSTVWADWLKYNKKKIMGM